MCTLTRIFMHPSQMIPQAVNGEISAGLCVVLRYGQGRFMETTNLRFVVGSQGALAWGHCIIQIEYFIYLDFKEIN